MERVSYNSTQEILIPIIHTNLFQINSFTFICNFQAVATYIFSQEKIEGKNFYLYNSNI